MSEKRKLKIGERQLISEKENIIEKGLSSKLKSEIGIKRPNNYEHGVTLIALVVTIIVLLILASVTISTIFSDNGIIKKAQEAANKTKEAVEQEQAELNQLYNDLASIMNNTTGGSTEEPEPEPEPELPSDGSFSEDKGVNTPNLGEGMTPIKWDETANSGAGDWVETDGSDPDWYDYSAKKWANAKTSDGSMWVWIPRFAYSITSGYHSSSTGTIEVEFMKGTSNEGATGQQIVNYNSSTTRNYTQFPNGYVIHPAFNYGETVSGIWVAKFEASQSNASASSTGSSGVIKVQPGVSSWRSITVNDIYTNCLNYNSTLNSHMMKNDEWGAVAYLSKSKYGKETEEVWINNSSSYITGSAGNSASASSNTGTTNDYTSTQGVKASTTGNVYGVYDMSGGAWEYVAAYVNNGNSSLTSYGNSLYTSTDSKTKNVYAKGSSDNNSSNYSANAGVYGDTVYETSANGNTINGSWYGDYSNFPDTSFPFFIRGGFYSDGSGAGVFYFDRDTGNAPSSVSFCPVLVAI